MDEAAVQAVLDDPVAQRVLDTCPVARLAYTGLDGKPRAIPIGYFFTGRDFLMFTVPFSAKVRALRANPDVALTIDTEDFPPNVLLVRGSATVEVVDGTPAEYLESGRRFVGDANYPAWKAGVEGLYEQMGRITVTPHWAKIHDFETRLPSAVEQLVRQKQ